MITINSSHVNSQNVKYQKENIYNHIELHYRLDLLDPKQWSISENDEVENIFYRFSVSSLN